MFTKVLLRVLAAVVIGIVPMATHAMNVSADIRWCNEYVCDIVLEPTGFVLVNPVTGERRAINSSAMIAEIVGPSAQGDTERWDAEVSFSVPVEVVGKRPYRFHFEAFFASATTYPGDFYGYHLAIAAPIDLVINGVTFRDSDHWCCPHRVGIVADSLRRRSPYFSFNEDEMFPNGLPSEIIVRVVPTADGGAPHRHLLLMREWMTIAIGASR